MKMHKNATKCNEKIHKWCKNKHGASKIIDTFETYQSYPCTQLIISATCTVVATFFMLLHIVAITG
jgi:hypothetical protein